MASSSAMQPRDKYDVFISFRGTDTRQTFTSHLHAALMRMKIDAYIDYRLEKGDEIGPALLEAIGGSKIFVIIFSQDYASSTWCLDELVHIMDCKERYKRIVIPIFYNIDPAVVRHQTKSYAEAFAIHKSRVIFREETLVEWKDALKRAANLSGFHSTSTTGNDSDLIDQVIKDILTKLNRESSSNKIEQVIKSTGLVGVESRIQQILLLLCNVPDGIRIRSVGIWGMGGIGKTTLANAVFQQLYSQFEACCFLSNVREESSEMRDLYHLRDKLYRKLLRDEKLTIETPTIGDTFVKMRLSRTKVLIVLDDVNDSSQLKFLVGDGVQFGLGSRIIVTTRDMQQMEVLRKGADHDVEIYKVEELNGDEARQLFHLNAPRDICSAADSKEFLKKVMDYAAGNPLALTIWRSLFFRCKRKEDLKDLWNKLKKFPDKGLLNVCRISYEALGENEREIFLDIVCFHKNQWIELVKRELDACDLYSNDGIKILIDMSLISIKDQCLWIHDVIQEFGWDIVRKECPEEPGKRSRLYTFEDIRHVLEKATGTATVKGICLQLKWDEIKEIKLTHPQVFTRMYNLTFLKFHGENRNNICLEDGKMDHFLDQESFPDSLRYLHWYHYPLKSLPSQFSLKNLVELHMTGSKLERLWNEGQNPENLKRIDLGFSQNLVEIPDLSKSENIESINLAGCEKLVRVPSSTRWLNKLVELNLEGCRAIKQLPESIGNFVGLKLLDLSECISLASVPQSIYKLNLLEELLLLNCCDLKELPSSSIISWSRIHDLDLSHCWKLEEIPDGLSRLTTLERLDLSASLIESIPPLGQLIELTSLDISGCDRLQSLREVPCFLETLNANDCTTLKTVSFSMTAITQGSDQIDISDQFCEQNHTFLGCLDLDENARSNIMNAAQLRIMRMATVLSKRKDINLQLFKKGFFSVSACVICPGNEIPKWFCHQTEGSSININLPAHSSDETFLGFVVCAVGTINGFHDVSSECRYNFKFNNGQCQGSEFSLLSYDIEYWLQDNFDSYPDHVFVWSLPFIFNDTEWCTEASFEFCATENNFGGNRVQVINVKRCGVRLWYAQDQDAVAVKTKRPRAE